MQLTPVDGSAFQRESTRSVDVPNNAYDRHKSYENTFQRFVIGELDSCKQLVSLNVKGRLWIKRFETFSYRDQPLLSKRDDENYEYLLSDAMDTPAVDQPILTEKRYMCRKLFAYSPIRNRCVPTMLVRKRI